MNIKHIDILSQAHPDYLSMGAWYDWVMVTFVCEESDSWVQDNEEQDVEKYSIKMNTPSKVFRTIKEPHIYAVVLFRSRYWTRLHFVSEVE